MTTTTTTMTTIGVRPEFVLVSCVGQKAAQPCEARDLYTSDWFKKARAFCDALAAPWFILSAQHGLVPHKMIIEPYDFTLRDMDRDARERWGIAISDELEQRGLWDRPGFILAGKLYRENVYARQLRAPLQGLGIGQQKQRLIQMAREV
jgi:hypothetical protein